jgi:predicted DNA-binding transcriptional regulator AlpA
MTDFKTSPRTLSTAQMCARFGDEKPLNKSTLWRRVKNVLDFPKPFYWGSNTPRWVEDEVDAYTLKKIAERDDPMRAAAQRERMARREERVSEPRALAQERARKAKARASRRRSKNHLQTPNTS